MNARMEKYNSDTKIKQRTKKNESLYSEVGNMNIDYVDIDVNNAVELSPMKSKKTSREDYQKQMELNKILPNNSKKEISESKYVEPKEERVYDINEILKMARQNKLFEDSEKKRLINTEYNILTKLDMDSIETEEMKKEDLRNLIDDIYEKEKPAKEEKIKKYKRSEEAKLLSDLFEEPEEQTQDIKIAEDLSKNILDKQETSEDNFEEEPVATQIKENESEDNEMYDFGLERKRRKERKKQKNMLEDVDLAKEMKKNKEEQEIEEEFFEEKESKVLIVAIIIVVILILVTCGFFVYEYFFGL